MKCRHCGKEIKKALINFFNHDGTDSYYETEFDDEFHEKDNKGAVFLLNEHWTGYEVWPSEDEGDETTEEEVTHTVTCPECKKPLFDKMRMYPVIQLVCWDESEE